MSSVSRTIPTQSYKKNRSMSCNCILRALKRADQDCEKAKTKYHRLKQKYSLVKTENRTLQSQLKRVRNMKNTIKIPTESSSSERPEEEEEEIEEEAVEEEEEEEEEEEGEVTEKEQYEMETIKTGVTSTSQKREAFSDGRSIAKGMTIEKTLFLARQSMEVRSVAYSDDLE